MKPATVETANAIPLLRTLGILLTEIGEDYAVMEVTIDERHLNYLGGAHGGLLATLVDTVCFFPGALLPSGRKVTTTNLNVHYVRGGEVGDHLIARSEILHLGKRTASLTVRVANGRGELVAHGSVTLLVLQQPDEVPAGRLCCRRREV